MDHETFYGAVLTTSPLILLTVSRGIIFGPVPTASRHRAWRLQRRALLTDFAAAFLVVAAAVYSLLVLAGVVDSTESGRNLVATAGVLALLFVLLHVAGVIATAHSADPDDRGAE